VGTTHLNDGARLTTFDQSVIQFLGDIKVRGRAELHYGSTLIATNAADVNVGTVQLLGRISSDAANSVLDLVDLGLDELVLDVSYHVSTGQTLQLLASSQPFEPTISGPNKSLSGGGTLLNSVRFQNGGAISPGDSPGTVSVEGSTTFGPGAIYTWEINALAGAAGQSVGWDLLHISDQLFFVATSQDPFVLKISGLDAMGAAGSVANWDPSQGHRWLIASADSIVGFDPAAVHIDASSFLISNSILPQSQFRLDASDGNLFLVYRVPEPASLVLLSITTVVILLGHTVNRIRRLVGADASGATN
jgi:hypothetical protein